MRTSHVSPAALAALVLAACQQSATSNAIANSGNAMANDAVMANVAMANGATAAKLPTSIPGQFHGRWGLNSADCTSTRGDAKGLLTISDARLTFYESRGTPDTVLGATAISFDARYLFSGEGQTWARTERLKLVDGKLNRRTDAEPDQEPPVNLTYSRC